MGKSYLVSSSNCPLAGGVVACLKLGWLEVPDELVLEVPIELELEVPFEPELWVASKLVHVVPPELELVWFNTLGLLRGCLLVDGFDERDFLVLLFDLGLAALDELLEPCRSKELTFVGEFVVVLFCDEPLELACSDRFTLSLLELLLDFPFRS
jgi:hypothetical protein